MANEVKLTFAGDPSDLNKAVDSVEQNLKGFDRQLESTADEARRFGGGVDGVADKLDNSESKFIATNDLISGLADTMGFALPPQAQMIMGFADMAGGLAGLLPSMAKAKDVMRGLNAVMRANPILTVVTVLALLTAGFIAAYKKSETFRNIVDGVGRHVVKVFKGMKDVIVGIADVITTPYRMAFNAIAGAWNNTVGRLSFSIPGWVPGIGGKGFDVPDIPTFANGGRFQPGWKMVGERGPELMYTDGAGGIVPRNQLGGGGGSTRVVVEFRGDGAFVEAVRKTARVYGGGDVQKAFGGR